MDETTDVPVAECPNCGATVLETYLDSGACPNCRDDGVASSSAED